MVIPNISPKTQNRIPTNSRVWPSVPRKRTWERSGSFRLASPPAASSGGLATAALGAPAALPQGTSTPADARVVAHGHAPSLLTTALDRIVRWCPTWILRGGVICDTQQPPITRSPIITIGRVTIIIRKYRIIIRSPVICGESGVTAVPCLALDRVLPWIFS